MNKNHKGLQDEPVLVEQPEPHCGYRIPLRPADLAVLKDALREVICEEIEEYRLREQREWREVYLGYLRQQKAEESDIGEFVSLVSDLSGRREAPEGGSPDRSDP